MSAQPKLNVVARDSAESPDSPCGDRGPTDCSDRLLLDAWISHQDADAFAAIVLRYAGIVMGVCRRQCRSIEDTEDAFQATFLALSRDAHRLRRIDSLAGWLHQVAYRTALRTRAKQPSTEALYEEPMDPHDCLTVIAQRHRLRTLDEELQRLPENYRSAVVLHYFEGHSYEQTAEILNTTEPAVRGRLQRARQRLHRRLVHRGVSLSIALAALAAVQPQEVIAAQLIRRTVAGAGKAGGGAALDPHLESLLASESSIMLSPTVVGVVGAATLTLAGLLIGQIPVSGTGAGNKRVMFAGDVAGADVPPVQTLVNDDRAQPPAADPFADPAAKKRTAPSSDPFNSSPATKSSQPQKTPAVDPFGSDPFAAKTPSKRVRPAAAPANTDPFGAPSAAAGDPFGGGSPAAHGRSPARPVPPQHEIPWVTANPEAFAKIERTLRQPASFTFIETPLEEAVDVLRNQFDLPVRLDTGALDDLQLSTDEPVSLQLNQVSLESGLNVMLRDLDLTYTIDDELLQITTREVDEAEHQLLRVYWVEDVGLQANEGSVALLQTMIEPDAWSPLGGSGDITILGGPSEQRSGFAVRATYRTHRKIERFLESVRSGTSDPLTGSVTGGEKRTP